MPAARKFSWGHAVLVCFYVAAAAASFSLMLDFLFGMIGVGYASRGQFSLGMFWIILGLLIPCAACGFYPAYRFEAYGWALGLISVAMWYFALRPLYYAILGWILSERFTFSVALDKWSLMFAFCLFLPAGALAGFLGERRARTGYFF